jgi:hypothetical protein
MMRRTHTAVCDLPSSARLSCSVGVAPACGIFGTNNKESIIKIVLGIAMRRAGQRERTRGRVPSNVVVGKVVSLDVERLPVMRI